MTASLPPACVVMPARVEEIAPPPCFFHKDCTRRAEVDKAGRSVCRSCAATLRGVEYPLRAPSADPPYLTSRAAAEALDMLED